MNKALKWGKKVAYGGFLGFCISAFFAEYTSQYLYAHYQSWSGWRSITGSNPNFLTSIILKASWAAFFLSTWFMIWRLDSFFNLPQTKRKETEDTKSKSPPQEEHEKEKKNPKPEEPQSSELD